MDFRIATWNVEYAKDEDRNAERLALILEADADVVVLTETHDDLELRGYGSTSTQQRPGARPGARWTTIWSRLPVRRRIATVDDTRTVAVELEGDLLVYGTVLPWHSDLVPHGDEQVSWAEFRRIVPMQGSEWRLLRRQYPGHTLIVAGDFNQSLGDRHYYGGRDLRRLLERECATADLRVLTGMAHAEAQLLHPAIDHVAVAAPVGRAADARDVTGWEGSRSGPGRLSDHSAVVVTVVVGDQFSSERRPGAA